VIALGKLASWSLIGAIGVGFVLIGWVSTFTRFYIAGVDPRRVWCFLTGGHRWDTSDEDFARGILRQCVKCWHMEGSAAYWRSSRPDR